MAWTIQQQLKDDVAAQIAATSLNGGSAVFKDSGGATLGSVSLTASATGDQVSVTTGSGTVTAGGTPVTVEFQKSDGSVVFTGTVGTSGADLNFDSVTWALNGTINPSDGTISCAGLTLA